MRYISRSSHEDYTKCPRRAYYRYLYKGTGFDQAVPSFNLLIGLAVHKGLEILLLTGDLEEAILKQQEEWKSLTLKASEIDRLAFSIEEGGVLSEALVRGWHRNSYPSFVEEFEVLMVEREVKALLAPNITLNARADGVLRRREDGANFVLNWKTSGSIRDWNQQWEDEIQAWTEALAMEDALGAPVQGVIFEGLFKGTFREGRNHSPLIYGWKLPTKEGRFLYSAEYKRYTKETPWVKFPVWTESFPFDGDSLVGWLNWLPADVLSENFVRSTPILKNNLVVEKWIRQVVRRETDMERMLQPDVPEQDREDFFVQHFSKWNCKGCVFTRVCKLQTTIEGMVETGELKERVDHHASPVL